MPQSPTVTVLVMVEAGSEYETKEKNGISHFLEHMCFKGTTMRPTALSISKELESIGSQYNAFTGEEYTGYYAKSHPKHVHKILDVVSNLYLNPVFPEKEIEKEKGVIIEEINMYRDMPHRHVQELFTELLYGDQPAGWNIAGTHESVRGMSRNDFISYRSAKYVAPATTVIVAGKFNEQKILKDIEAKFGILSTAKIENKSHVTETQNLPMIKIEDRKTDQAHIVLGMRGVPVAHKDTAALRVLSAVLGAGMSSRLFQKLREEMGVGYYVRSSYDGYADHGIFSVSVGCDVKRVEEVVSAVMKELLAFTTENVGDEELKKTKDYLIGSMYLGLESSDSLAEFYGFQEILRRDLKKPAQIVKEIQAVTAADIRKIAKKYFVDKHLNLAIVGPVKDEEALKKILHF